MMIVVVVIFAVCWLPYHVYFLVAHHLPHILNETFVQPTYLIIYWLAMSNACYNPFIYCWMNSRIQECVPLLHVEGRKDQPSGTKKVYCCPPKYGEWNYGSSNGDRVPEFKQSSDLQQICAP
ncbi:hypothetical protein CDAR_206011 [Caerostris darwini]|uniref:G-protein coupled receptors family 1 profile domain-containing protein n=1 Tax=Caerostris darwini TaxID=1538125 RepID=A0AAV4VJD5_9ARAC|nr:hypothetical protein CDAR_206011 [Caerostris darwini]